MSVSYIHSFLNLKLFSLVLFVSFSTLRQVTARHKTVFFPSRASLFSVALWPRQLLLGDYYAFFFSYNPNQFL